MLLLKIKVSELFLLNSNFIVEDSTVTLYVQDGCKLVSTSLVRGQACIIACMASLESGNGQKAGKVIYYSDGHQWVGHGRGQRRAVFQPIEADRRVTTDKPAKYPCAGVHGQYRGQRRRNRAKTEGR